ncbi:MAG: TorF family putative porin [Betaproteobacteria bacterium]
MKFVTRASLAATMAALPLLASAQAKPEPEYTLTANITLASEYLYRGIAQTAGKPAIQGGFDFAHQSGFYLGNWNSNISWLSDANPGLTAPIEMDFYGGWKTTLGDIGLDFGGLYYYYPVSNKPSGYNSADTFEAYIGATWGPATLKFSYAFTDLFGLVDSDGSYYIDGTVNYPIGETGFSVLAHLGYQDVSTGSKTATCLNDTKDYSYLDWKLGGSYTLAGWTFGAYYSDTDAETACFTNPQGRDLGKGRFLATIGRSF